MKYLTKFFSLIKNDKKIKILSIVTIAILFIFTFGYSLSLFNNDSYNKMANININDLSFNLTTNNGASNDRILHLQAGKNELFNVTITNLNNVDSKYELIYDVCSDSNCSNILNSLPSAVTVDYLKDNSDGLNGIIYKNNGTRKITLITINGSNQDYYIRLNLNAGYSWNDLSLSNQISDYNSYMSIVSYVDGIQTNKYPDSCNYAVSAKAYRNNVEVNVNDLSITCDRTTNTWKTSYSGFIDKLDIKFTYAELNPTTFANDSWDVIVEMIRQGKGGAYTVGSLKTVNILGTNYTVRVANNSTPSECNGSNFSQSACGFVVELVDIYETRVFGSGAASGENIGGWANSKTRTYANESFYYKLPENLRNIILDTKVISGHGSKDSANFVTTDKIYLLSAKEVWNGNQYDSATGNTRQLDYYSSIGVTLSNPSGAIKKYNGTASSYFTRTMVSVNNINMLTISSSGGESHNPLSTNAGFAPAFRIG